MDGAAVFMEGDAVAHEADVELVDALHSPLA